MRSIKQILKEIKKEYDKLFLENEERKSNTEEEIDDIDLLDEDNYDYIIKNLYEYITENFNKDEITLFVTYLVKEFLYTSYEDIYEGLTDNIDNKTKNMMTTRLRILMENENVYNPSFNNEELDEILNILDYIIENNFDEDFEDEHTIAYNDTLEFIKEIIENVKNNEIYSEFMENEDFYYELLQTYDDINNEATLPITIYDIETNDNTKINTIEDFANIVLKNLFYSLNYYNTLEDTIEIIDKILNEETDVETSFYKKYFDKYNFKLTKEELIKQMKVVAVKNYYKAKSGMGLIAPSEKPILSKIIVYNNDIDVLNYIYDESYEFSFDILEHCYKYYNYKDIIEKNLLKTSTNDEDVIVNDITKINNHINKLILNCNNTLKNKIKTNKTSFYNMVDFISDKSTINVYSEYDEKRNLSKKMALKYIKNLEDPSIEVIFDNDKERASFIFEYIFKNSKLSEEEKEIFIIKICEEYLNNTLLIDDKYNEYFDVYHILNSADKKEWYEILKVNSDVSSEIYNYHMQKIESMQQPIKLNPNNNKLNDKNIILMQNLYSEVFDDIIINFKNDLIGYSDEEISMILYNYLCDIVTIDKKYYKYYFKTDEYNENFIKYIFRSLLISDYYKILKNQESHDDKEKNYINIIEDETFNRKYIDDYFASNKIFAQTCIKSYINNMDKNKDIICDEKIEKTLKKIGIFKF